MTLSEMLLPEFDHELANTRKTLERIPEDKFDWKPHEKSASMGGLATHLANLPSWAALIVNQDSLDLATTPNVAPAKSLQEVLEAFDRNVASARGAIAGASDELLGTSWALLSGGQTLFALPRIAVLRSFVMNHNIHHRAQMGVYLRFNDIAVPSIYGPSADESGM